MRKLFYSLSALALVAATGCQESSMNSDIEAGDYATVTINTNAITSVGSRAALADNSDEALVYYLEIYKDGEFYTDLGKSTDGRFSTRLITGQEYTLVAWADYNKGFYNADSDLENGNLTNVALVDAKYAINDINRDAFCGTNTVTITENTAINVDATRPFARINVRTNDIAAIPAGFDMIPTEVELVYTDEVYTAFNVLEGDVVKESVATFTTPVTATVDTEGELSADYLFAANDGGVAQFTANYTTQDGKVDVTSYDFANIPYKRNYQTNVSGNLLTKQGDITVTVDKDWNTPSEEVTILSGDVPASAINETAIPEGDKWSIVESGIENLRWYMKNGIEAAMKVANQPLELTFTDVEGIGNSLLRDNSLVTKVSAPAATIIDWCAIYNCSSLVEVYAPSVTTIGMQDYLDALRTMTIGVNAEFVSIDAMAFGDTNYYSYAQDIDLTIGKVNEKFVSGNVLTVGKNSFTFKSITVVE